MSKALVKKALLIVEGQDNKIAKRRKKSDVFELAPQNQKLFTKGYKKEGKEVKVNLLSANKKLTVSEARKTNKSKEQILQENLKKLELIRKASKVNLDERIVDKIIKRAVNKRPVRPTKDKVEKKTAFTDEDFKKFEEEYFDE